MKKFALIYSAIISFSFFCLAETQSDFDIAESCENGDKQLCDMIMLRKQVCNNRDDLTACNSIGNYYYRGVANLLPQDYYQSFKYYQKACNGNIEKTLAIFTLNNKPITNNDDKEMIKNFFIIPKKLYACGSLADCYYKGQGTRVDYKKAADLHRQVCYDKCDTDYCNEAKSGACNNLGWLYDFGKGVRMDKIKAKELYGKACDLGEQLGCDNYRKLIEQGY